MTADGLRERNKYKKREAILRAAHQLFIERGYEATTIADVAERAEVSRRTVTLYFPTKLSLALAPLDALETRLDTAIRGREPGWSVIDAVERWLYSELDRPAELSAPTERMLVLNPELQASHKARMAEIVEAGARRLVEETGTSPDDRDARMTAAAAAALCSSLGPQPTRDDIVAVMAFLRAGVEALASRGE
ncbi:MULTISPECIES: TetR/AcrR family transcriptional regulator [unclassified Streptomyces]|uniref:TetR/AcrR family transcriptional regulator n=1 Tax=unclassified Streptomyces TaxID=2593676 RepID=UPI0011CD959F|nr:MULTISPECIES: TetR/AcrR family transcriptional regulator [unclassified Streptomyces]TXS70996.1 TetR/AcrR family transcriptional regulator [Streptomyces sp. me109]